MGLTITPTNKTPTAIYDEAWAINIQSAQNPSGSLIDSQVTCHRRERTVYSDGSFSATDQSDKTSEGFAQKVSFKMSEIVARSGTLAYTDKTGEAKTVPESDVPLIVKALVDLMAAEARQAKLDAIKAQAGE